MKMTELNLEDRPREKMAAKGAAALGNDELLAILLRTGTVKENVIEISRKLLSAGGSLTGLSAMSPEMMMETPGIGRDKATTIGALFELSRRFASEAVSFSKQVIDSPEAIFRMMNPMLKGLDHEEFWVIYLNRANYMIGKEMMSAGGGSSTTVDAKMIARKALAKKASGIIMVHNHPSGSPLPSDSDVTETQSVKKALDSLDIYLMDHIIICDDCYFSFADERSIEKKD